MQLSLLLPYLDNTQGAQANWVRLRNLSSDIRRFALDGSDKVEDQDSAQMSPQPVYDGVRTRDIFGVISLFTLLSFDI